MDYELDLEIDEDALDVEWLNQPMLAMKWGAHWAHCQRKVQKAEEKVKLVRSELIAEAYEDPSGTMGVDKATAQSVEAYYRNHDDHKEAKEELIQAHYDLDVAEIAKKEICISRKDALKNLVELLKINYFESPLEPRDLSHEAMKKRQQKETDAGVAGKMKRKKNLKRRK